MEEQGLPTIQGERFKISISASKAVEIINKEITDETYDLFKRIFPGVIKTKYEYSKTALAERLKDPKSYDAIALSATAKIVENKHIRWGIVK
jgi:hypothetical protein